MKKEVIKSNKHIYIIKSIYTVMFVLLTAISIFTFNSLTVKAAESQPNAPGCNFVYPNGFPHYHVSGGITYTVNIAKREYNLDITPFAKPCSACNGTTVIKYTLDPKGSASNFFYTSPVIYFGRDYNTMYYGSPKTKEITIPASSFVHVTDTALEPESSDTIYYNKNYDVYYIDIYADTGKAYIYYYPIDGFQDYVEYTETYVYDYIVSAQYAISLSTTPPSSGWEPVGWHNWVQIDPEVPGSKLTKGITNYVHIKATTMTGKTATCYVPLHVHRFTDTVTKAATCTAKGVRTYTCSCGKYYTEEIAALGHAWPSAWAYTTNSNITSGLAYKNCTRCGTRLDSKWLNRIRVRYQKADGTYGDFSNVVNGYYYSGNTISWSREADATYQSASTSWTSTTAAKSVDITVYRNKVTLDLNSWLDGEQHTNLGNYATADVYINGVQVANDVSDYYNTELLYGASYEIKDIKAKTGFTYNGLHSGSDSLSGTLNGSRWVAPDFTTNYYTLTLNKGTGISSVSGAGSKKYGSSVTIDATVKPGYTWKNWTGTYTKTDKKSTFNMPAHDVTLTANATANTYYVDYAKGLTNNAGNTPKTTHTYDKDVILASNGFTGRTYNLKFDANKPKNGHGQTTSSKLTNLPSTQSGNLSFYKWSVSATYNSGNYNASTNLDKMNFESTNGATAHATALWNSKTLKWNNPSLVGYTFTGWYYSDNTKVNTDNSNNKVIVYPDDKEAYNKTVYAHWSPNTDTPYKVEHWIQKVTDSFKSDSDPKEYELFETENFTGTTDTLVTPSVKQYNGCIAPTVQTVNIAGDGSTVVKYYYTRIKITLDINAEYLGKYYPTNTPSMFDVYVNDRIVATQVRDYYSDQILYGSTWDVRNINPDAGKHYYGVDVN